MKILNFLAYPLLVIIVILTAIEFVSAGKIFISHFQVYTWLLVGVAGYVVLNHIPGINLNKEMLQTFAHELSHMIAGLLMFHKIHDFRAREKEGVIYHSGRFGNTFITMAPYTLLIFTFPFLLFRLMGQNAFIYIIDICIGFTTAFHVNCFWRQTHHEQPDLKRVGYLKSGLYIAGWHFFNASLIILSIRKGLWGALGYLFSNYWNDISQLVS